MPTFEKWDQLKVHYIYVAQKLNKFFENFQKYFHSCSSAMKEDRVGQLGSEGTRKYILQKGEKYFLQMTASELTSL